MNFLENNSTKIAGILCTASMLPVVGTVMAMETAPGWKADQKYITEEGTYAKGWQEIDGDTYYFDEEGSLDLNVTAQAYSAKAAPKLHESMKETILDTLDQIEEEETEEQTVENEVQVFSEEESEVRETPVQTETSQPVVSEEAPVLEVQPEVNVPEQPAADSVIPEPEMTPEAPVVPEAPQEPEYTAPVQPEAPVVPEAPAVPEAPQEPEYTAPVQPEAPVVPEAPQEPEYTAPVQPEAPVVPEAPQEPEYTAPVQPEVPSVPETPAQPAGQYDQLNQNIANAALGMVGVTNGWQCTEVATGALNQAGVGAGVVWPDQYIQYGYVTDTPQAGNLIYYDQGGRGLDHIAVYIGNGQAVHGNYNGQTVVADAYLSGVNNMYFIQITV